MGWNNQVHIQPTYYKRNSLSFDPANVTIEPLHMCFSHLMPFLLATTSNINVYILLFTFRALTRFNWTTEHAFFQINAFFVVPLCFRYVTYTYNFQSYFSLCHYTVGWKLPFFYMSSSFFVNRVIHVRRTHPRIPIYSVVLYTLFWFSILPCYVKNYQN